MFPKSYSAFFLACRMLRKPTSWQLSDVMQTCRCMCNRTEANIPDPRRSEQDKSQCNRTEANVPDARRSEQDKSPDPQRSEQDKSPDPQRSEQDKSRSTGIGGYDYFKRLSTEQQAMDPNKPRGIAKSVISEMMNENLKKEEVSENYSIIENKSDLETELLKTEGIQNVSEVEDKEQFPVVPHKPQKKIPSTTYNLATYVNHSELLTNFVKLGVDLSKVEQIKGIGTLLLKLDFEQDVKPYLLFLNTLGLTDDEIGLYLTKNPMILKESLDDLHVRINYLMSKKFSPDEIKRIVTKAHLWLLHKVPLVDSRLGYYQKEFSLTGDELRTVITKLPKLVTWEPQMIKDMRFYIIEFLGFSKSETKDLLLAFPKVMLIEQYSVGQRFDYVYNKMGFSHARILQWPQIFDTRLHIIRQRDEFLKSLGRDQYDPSKENFVPLKRLVSGKDQDFCSKVAKSNVRTFNDFLKTL